MNQPIVEEDVSTALGDGPVDNLIRRFQQGATFQTDGEHSLDWIRWASNALMKADGLGSSRLSYLLLANLLIERGLRVADTLLNPRRRPAEQNAKFEELLDCFRRLSHVFQGLKSSQHGLIRR